MEPDEATRGELLATAKDLAAAIVSNDPEQMARCLADDWLIVSETGVSSRQEFLAVVESGDLTHSAMQLISDPRVQVYGDTAMFTCRITNTAHYRGQRFDADEWTTDVFVRRDGRWMCVLSHITAAAPNNLGQ
jgi:hypothetical protein